MYNRCIKPLLGAGALVMLGTASQAAILGPSSSVTSEFFALEFGEFYVLDETFSSGPLTGVDFDFFIDFSSGLGDSFTLAGENATDFTVIEDDGGTLRIAVSNFNGAPSEFPRGGEVEITGFPFGTGSVIASLAEADADGLDLLFDGNDQPVLSFTFSPVVIPLPAAAWLLLGGIGALASMRGRRTT